MSCYYYRKNEAVLDGETLAVKIIIEELMDGTIYYDLLVDRDEKDGIRFLECRLFRPMSPG